MLGEVSAGALRPAGPRPQVRPAARGHRRRPHRLPDPAALVPAGSGEGAGHAARLDRLLLARVRHHRGAAAVLRRPRHPGRRPPQGGQRPRRADHRRRSALRLGLLPPVALARRLAARAVPVPRPARAADQRARERRRHAGPGRDRVARVAHAARPDLGGPGRPRPAAAARQRHRGERRRRPPGHRPALRRRQAEHRLEQELLLGVGGVRAIRAYCAATGTPAPTVFHTNEGHAGFLGVERIRELVEGDGLDFDEALQAVRAGTVFTTHTPVPAGIDRFDRDARRRAPGRHEPAACRADPGARRRGGPGHLQHGAHGPAARPARERRLACCTARSAARCSPTSGPASTPPRCRSRR